MLVPSPYDHAQCPTTPILGIFRNIYFLTPNFLRELQWVGKLLDKFPYSHLPTKIVVLRRVMFQIEQDPSVSLLKMGQLVYEELKNLWEYAGYGDILQHHSNILKWIYILHASYKKLLKIPVNRRQSPSFLQSVSIFSKAGDELFDITIPSLRTSSLITPEDSDFLINHWDKTISSTKDTLTQATVAKKLAREEKRQSFLSKHSTSSPPPSSSAHPDPSQSSPDTSANLSPHTASPDFNPKRPRVSTLSGTSLFCPPNILEVLGPVADRTCISNNQLVALTAAFVNHCGGGGHGQFIIVEIHCAPSQDDITEGGCWGG